MGEEGDDYTYRYAVSTRNDTCIKVGSDESHFTVSFIVRDKVTRQCTQTTTFYEEKGEPKRNRAEVPSAYQPYRWAKPAHTQKDLGSIPLPLSLLFR